jgi:polyisoprenoid-binding protein YceI
MGASEKHPSTRPSARDAFRPHAVRFLALASLMLPFAANAKEYQAIKGESSLTYVLIHPMHTIKGVTRDFDCKVDLSGDTVSSKIRVSADVKTFDSGNSSRDSHALEAIQGLKYPRVTFESRSIKPDSGGYTVAGDLTFHGKTRPIAFHVTPTVEKEKIEIAGTFDILLSDYGVERPSLMFVKCKDNLTLRFDLFAKP